MAGNEGGIGADAELLIYSYIHTYYKLVHFYDC